MRTHRNPILEKVRTDTRGAVMLYGPKGLFQTEDALYLAKKVLSDEPEGHPDFINYVGITPGVEEVNAVSEKMNLLPARADRYVVILDHLEKMSVAAQNKLLKVLEEGNAFFILIANGFVLDTIRSRVFTVSYRPYGVEEFSKITGMDEAACYVYGGCPEGIEENELEPVFRQAGEALAKGDAKKLMEVLHLVKEKDPDSFYEKAKDYVPSLFAYFGHVLQTSNFKNSCKAAEYAIACENRSYVAADFFRDVVSLLPERRK